MAREGEERVLERARATRELGRQRHGARASACEDGLSETPSRCYNCVASKALESSGARWRASKSVLRCVRCSRVSFPFVGFVRAVAPLGDGALEKIVVGRVCGA